jgi:hypothetical protein
MKTKKDKGFKTHNEVEVNIDGTSLVGIVTVDYVELVQLFGKPNPSDGYKVDAEWEIEFNDGVVGTIYNWKNGKNYLGPKGLPKNKIREWHIGGLDTNVVQRIETLIQNHRA